ncbi:nicotinate phosphoribosyltransferase [Sulfuricella sp. T08]|uniref:nicotinate phosphoribosyltransferase n=1 Tax=Sulfuricella sp. T08 TaxID=1632857 RepID=UPI0006179F99|nr:nicotinate phosphoribosyltransferase [Sulfuricella sp. T08]GAO37514.1 nicotinate phosphoribosyltransferase [Sulfuricella sp. T08]
MNPQSSPLLTDLYQLTMLQAYYDEGMDDTAVFEFFVRDLPPQRNFLLAAGLEQVLQFLENLRFTPEEVDWVANCGRFSREFTDFLASLCFTGDVHAMPEGTLFFPHQPILRITAPITQAQLVESRVINLLHLQTLIASKAARSVLVAPGKLLVDFGLRRAHGAEAGLLAARASYLAGYSGSATVLAGAQFSIPLYGTMAHSYIQAHTDEIVAFERFAHSHPTNTVLLIDTYDTEAAAEKVVKLAPRLEQQGIHIKAVRLDSGNLAEHARKVRRILDQGGCRKIGIFCSGNLDEYAIHQMLADNAPVDGFGVGTLLDTSADAPYLDCAYKLVEYAGKPSRKRSEGKATWPGRKQVYRSYGADGSLERDTLTLEHDTHSGTPLIEPCMQEGKRLSAPEPLERVRQRAASELERLPRHLRQLETSSLPYTVEIAPALRELAAAIDRAAH